MSSLRFDVPLPAGTDSEAVERVAERLSAALGELPQAGPAAVEPMGSDRSLVEVGAAIAVALPVLAQGVGLIDGILDVFEKLRKHAAKDEEIPSEERQILVGLEPKDIMVRVGRSLVPLDQLTIDDLEKLRGKRS